MIRILAVALLGIVLFLVAACGEETTPTATAILTPTPTPTSTTTPVATPTPTTTPVALVEPRGILDVGMPEIGPPNFLLHQQVYTQQRFDEQVTHETMFVTDQDSKVVGRLVTDWEVDPSGLVYTFHLQEGAKWNDSQGRDWGEFNADDFIFTIEQVTREGAIHSKTSQFRRLFACEECTMTKIDEHTLELKRPSPTFEINFYSRLPVGGSLTMHSKKHFDAVGEEQANLESVGTGPYTLIDAKADRFRQSEAVREHWCHTPEWEQMIWWEIAEDSTRVANFLTGALDTGSYGLDSIQAIKANEDPDVEFMIFPGALHFNMQIFGLQYNTNHPAHLPSADGEEPRIRIAEDAYQCELPWVGCNSDTSSEEWQKALKVRKAMALAIDRQKLINNLAFGEGTPRHIAWWMGFPAREKEFGLDQLKYEYDPTRARELLAEAGYADGFEIDVALTPRPLTGTIEMGKAVSTMLEEVGITTRQQEILENVWRPRQLNRSFQGLRTHNEGVYDPLILYDIFYSSTSAINLGFEHPDFQAMLAETQHLVDDEQRWAKYADIARWIFDNVMILPLYDQNAIWPLGPGLGPWDPMPGDLTWLSNWEYAPHR